MDGTASTSQGKAPLASDCLRIRHARPDDYEAFAATMSTPRAYSGTLQLPYASPEVWRERLAKTEPGGVVLVAEARGASDAPFEVVANLGLHPNASLRRRHAVMLGMSVRDDWQGRGLGSALMTAALDRADNWMNVLRVELTVFVDNPRAFALYQRFGFEVEGRLRAYALRNGAYADVYTMARLHPAPPVLARPEAAA